MLIALLWVILGAGIGAVIGEKKHRAGEGAFIGALLGPLGWLIMALGKNMGPKCPACKGDIIKDAIKCKNCGSDLKWSEIGS